MAAQHPERIVAFACITSVVREYEQNICPCGVKQIHDYRVIEERNPIIILFSQRETFTRRLTVFPCGGGDDSVVFTLLHDRKGRAAVRALSYPAEHFQLIDRFFPLVKGENPKPQ